MSEHFVNTFAGSPLNRLSWLRTSHPFLNAIVKSPATRWILLNNGQLLVSAIPDTRKRDIAYLSTADVRSLLGDEPFFGQAQNLGETVVIPTGDEKLHPALESARHRGPRVVFLGLHEADAGGSGALPSSDFDNAEEAVANLNGTPYFAFDVADAEADDIDSVLQGADLAKSGKTLSWSEPRAASASFDAFTSAVFANAKSMVDWNVRHKFCAGCGAPAYSQWGGWKLTCTTLLPWADNTARKPCPSGRGLHNYTHPRTDAVVIMLAVDETGEKILLGRGKKFPGKFYSALAGFIEPAESFEDAVQREMWEEAGVRVRAIQYHSSQPWPYPANLMSGFYARADSAQPLRTDLDNELEDARWVTREEVLKVLRNPAGTNFSGRDHKQLAKTQEGRYNVPKPDGQAAEAPPAPPADEDEPAFKVPPRSAIAGVLISDWAEGRVTFEPEAPKRGNL